ncbi:TetR/AcrR family transcriptional regulator [Rhodococcus fascians]|nr:TetR/AcrR family transcriptional regulator [Rhodococcus fascians]MBY4140933.1 TetR/AcrR family transcriptional regulator [Rhodococcus fascians]MBY4219597.1 TetR/AcrR family transcriptional regulator [Rhodococcus fascians]MBY4221906.1 TetR/AcrR family transcriptional regulator [Rhodococcus fascians]MBY4233907.1 TetR/AcrR family transcriptional regulator [Rhodococcus fascians]
MVKDGAGAPVRRRKATTGGAAARKAPAKASPRETRRQQRIELSREQILDTAENLFAEHGYYQTGLKDVAAACEFSVGSIYTFFESKDVLYEQVLMRRSIGVEALQIMVPESVPADERLVKLAEVWIRHADEYPAWGSLTAEITRITRSPGGVVPDAWIHHGQRTQNFLVDVIEKGQDSGHLRPGSPSSLARLYWALVTSFIVVTTMGRMSGNEQPSDAEEFLSFIQDTFSTRPAAHPEDHEVG